MQPLKSLQAKDYIVLMLREKIFSGEFEDGSELTQELLAQQLGVSRMPVREALQQLEMEGMLHRLPNRHMRVVGITAQRVQQHFSVLAAMEAEMMALVLQEELDTGNVREALRQYSMAVPLQGPEVCTEREIEIHRQFAVCLDNPMIAKLHSQLLTGYFAYTLKRVQRDWKKNRALLQSIFEHLNCKDLLSTQNALRHYFEEAAQAAIGGLAIDQSQTDHAVTRT